MKTRLLFLASALVLLTVVLSVTTACAQELLCSMTSGETKAAEQVPIGGRYRTSSGVLRLLVVFVRFKDDNETTSSWPDTNALPYWAANFVDSSVSTIGSTDTRNLSTYFYENSYGKLKLIGDVYYITTDSNESYYHNYSISENTIRGHLNREILIKLHGAPYNVNFARYDKWVDSSEYSHTYSEGGDGKVDLIWMITRNLHDATSPAGRRFGRAAADFQVEGGSLTLDGVTIYHTSDFMSMNSSGITLFGPNIYSPRYIYDASAPTGVPTLVGTMAHEMSHYFFGSGHLGSGIIAPRRGNGIFSGYSGNASNCFSHYLGYEKYRLGWLCPTVYTSNTDSVVLYDLATTADSAKDRLLKMTISGTNQYFLIENRRWISNFETRYSPYNLSHAVLSPGIIVYHIISENPELPLTRAQIRSADGRFVWKFVQGGETATQSDDVIDKDSADFVNGYDEREGIYFPNKSGRWRAAYLPGENRRWYPNATNYRDTATDVSDDTGDKFDVFDVGYVINPWSNPGSHSWNSHSRTFSQTTIGVEVTGFNSTTQAYILSIRVSSPEDLSPSKPQNLKGVYGGSGQVNLTWTPNGEPDMSQYRIYRDGQLVQTVAHPPASDRVTPNAQTVLYAIKAHDTQGKESVVSDPISVFLPPAPPVLASPANRAINVPTSSTLRWTSSTGATSCGLQVSVDSSFSTPVVNQAGITATSFAVSGLANNTAYYWRVSVSNVSGPSDWSSTRSFKTIPSPPPPPTLPSPRIAR
jgi:M6 family metalloprotease-like protein